MRHFLSMAGVVLISLTFIPLGHAQDEEETLPPMPELYEEEVFTDKITDPEQEITLEEEVLDTEEEMLNSLETRLFEQRGMLRNKRTAMQNMRGNWQNFSQTEKGSHLREYRNQFPRVDITSSRSDMMQVPGRGGRSASFREGEKSFGKNLTMNSWKGRYSSQGKSTGSMILWKLGKFVFGLLFLFGGSFCVRKGWNLAGKTRNK